MNTKPKSLAATLFLATGLAVSAQAQPTAAAAQQAKTFEKKIPSFTSGCWRKSGPDTNRKHSVPVGRCCRAALESIGQVADGLGWRWITQ